MIRVPNSTPMVCGQSAITKDQVIRDTRGLVGIFTFLLRELVEETRLADTHITDDDIFENIGVIVGSGGHFS